MELVLKWIVVICLHSSSIQKTAYCIGIIFCKIRLIYKIYNDILKNKNIELILKLEGGIL